MPDHCIVYFSSSVLLDQEVELLKLLQYSRRENTKAGITGVLLYVRGSLVQVLEGQQVAVETLYRRIESDTRHTNVALIVNRPISHRLFAEWSMGYETLTTRQLAEIEKIVYLNVPRSSMDQAGSNAFLKMIHAFYESNRFN